VLVDGIIVYLSLLVEDRLGLTTETRLLAVITTLALGIERVLALLVLGDLPLAVDLAMPAIGLHLLGEVHHLEGAGERRAAQKKRAGQGGPDGRAV
jgi:hypothetical protein